MLFVPLKWLTYTFETDLNVYNVSFFPPPYLSYLFLSFMNRELADKLESGHAHHAGTPGMGLLGVCRAACLVWFLNSIT